MNHYTNFYQLLFKDIEQHGFNNLEEEQYKALKCLVIGAMEETEQIRTDYLDEIMDLTINTLLKHEKVQSNAIFHIKSIQKREKIIHCSKVLLHSYFRTGSINHNLARIIHILALSRKK